MPDNLPDYVIVPLLWLAAFLPVILAYGVKHSRRGFKIFMWILWLMGACGSLAFWRYAETVHPGIDGNWGVLVVLINLYWFLEAANSKFLPRKKKETATGNPGASTPRIVDAESGDKTQPSRVNLTKDK